MKSVLSVKAVGLDFVLLLSLFLRGLYRRAAPPRFFVCQGTMRDSGKWLDAHAALLECEQEYLHDDQARKTVSAYRAPMHVALVVRSWGRVCTCNRMLVETEPPVGRHSLTHATTFTTIWKDMSAGLRRN